MQEETITGTPPVAEGRQPVPHGVLGGRYRLDRLLGVGGMGAVWRAYDLKLRTDVALKSLLQERVSEPSRERFREEVRAARTVVSPHVCRVFDLFEVDGQEFVSMEFVDGTTLQEVLEERAPLELGAAQRIASQLLSGLEEIHRCGLVHCDLKPSNIMLTRSGRVVIMDFGLAHAIADRPEGVRGTPAYMAPEQMAGGVLGPSADLYSAALVLLELVSPDGVRDCSSRRRLWEGARSDPPQLPDTPWSSALRRALVPEVEGRCSSAGKLLRMLDEVTLRLSSVGRANPYPGLASFTEENADSFFGRESEIEQIWQKLDQPRIQALIGPSGAGKTSFLRAGLMPSAPAEWAIVRSTPGTAPMMSLARSLAPFVVGDSRVIDDLLRFEDADVATRCIARWRRRNGQAMVIVDQFEELFALNPAGVQEGFASFLGRLPIEADTYVLLAMRDDFLFHCAGLAPLAPVFSDPTPLRVPSGSALRRAVVQPALACGYRFENESLVEAILAGVENERAALSLMAFAVSQLWERRDRENGLLTWSAYREIGGVAGAIALHAEATLARIGNSRIPVVQELFRNLVTAQRTRVARDRDELLSLFATEERCVAEEVLDALIAARLLTAYEVEPT